MEKSASNSNDLRQTAEPLQKQDPKSLYEELLAHKRKRDDLNARVREAVSDIRLLKEERDRVNSEVKALKEQRNLKREEGKKVLELARELRKAMSGISVPKNSSDALTELIEELDFKYQTNPVPFEQEKRLVKRIEELKQVLRARKFFEKKNANLSKLSGDVHSLFSSSNELHETLLKKAEESEALHKEFVSKIRLVEDLRVKSDSEHKEVVRLSRLLGDAREEDAARREKTRLEEMLEREQALKEKVEQVKKSLEGKKSFNFRDLQVLGAAGEEFSFEKRAAEEKEETDPK